MGKAVVITLTSASSGRWGQVNAVRALVIQFRVQLGSSALANSSRYPFKMGKKGTRLTCEWWTPRDGVSSRPTPKKHLSSSQQGSVLLSSHSCFQRYQAKAYGLLCSRDLSKQAFCRCPGQLSFQKCPAQSLTHSKYSVNSSSSCLKKASPFISS